MNGLSILGTGRCLPDHIVTNDDLARRVETSNDWIVSRTGIRERRFAQGETLTQLAVAAARRAMERVGVSRGKISLWAERRLHRLPLRHGDSGGHAAPDGPALRSAGGRRAAQPHYRYG